jgi:hypothetical protein
VVPYTFENETAHAVAYKKKRSSLFLYQSELELAMSDVRK